MNATNNTLYTAILDAANKSNKVQTIVRECFVSGDKYMIVEAARMIDEHVKFDKAQKNQRLSALRNAMARVCKEMDIPKLTVKKVDGSFAVVDAGTSANKVTDFTVAVEKLVEKACEENQMATLRDRLLKAIEELDTLALQASESATCLNV